VDKARKYLRGSFAIEHQSPDAMADAMAEIAFYHLPGDYYDTYLDRIDAVTVDDIKRVASRFPSDRLVILVLGKAEEVKKDLESLGPVTVLPLDSR
jgi:predicted Zn-dependent peptidase